MNKYLLTALFAGVVLLGPAAAGEPRRTASEPVLLAQAESGHAEQAHPGASGHASADKAAHEAGAVEHGESHGDPNIWWKWLNFAILFGGLAYLAKKVGGPYFASRSESIQSGIREASRVREEAEARAADIERRVAALSTEVEQMRHQSKDEIAREGERVRLETAAQIAKVQAQAQSEIASAAKHASQDLKAYAAQLAIDLAERQIRDSLDANTQDALADSFVADLKSKAVVN